MQTLLFFLNKSVFFQGTDCQTTYYGCLLGCLSKASIVPEMKTFIHRVCVWQGNILVHARHGQPPSSPANPKLIPGRSISVK